MHSVDKLVMMANQIAKNLAVRGDDRAVAGTADHIRRFWDPRMRSLIADALAKGGDGLDPLARRAVEAVGKPAKGKA
jgi:formate dehydrogenase subunit delta